MTLCRVSEQQANNMVTRVFLCRSDVIIAMLFFCVVVN